MKVVCIDDTETIIIGPNVLTNGRVYEVIDNSDPVYDYVGSELNRISYLIVGDDGKPSRVIKGRFVPIEKYRQSQINNILE